MSLTRRFKAMLTQLPGLSIFLFVIATVLTGIVAMDLLEYYKQEPLEVQSYRAAHQVEIQNFVEEARQKFQGELPIIKYSNIPPLQGKRFPPSEVDSINAKFRSLSIAKTALSYERNQLILLEKDSLRYGNLIYSDWAMNINVRIDTSLVPKNPDFYYACYDGRCEPFYSLGVAGIPFTKERFMVKRQIRIEILIPVIAFIGLLFFTGFYYPKLVSADPLGRDQTLSKDNRNSKAADYLEAEVEKLWDKCSELYNRSSYLLIGGILIAFSGILFFFLAMPQERLGNITELWVRGVRSFGVLLFIESIAWFLLRQYRTLMEDFKGFYKLKIKKTNQLIALKILEESTANVATAVVVGDLLQENLSGKLQNGETTEQLEASKITDHNPVFDLLNKVVDKMPHNKAGADGTNRNNYVAHE